MQKAFAQSRTLTIQYVAQVRELPKLLNAYMGLRGADESRGMVEEMLCVVAGSSLIDDSCDFTSSRCTGMMPFPLNCEIVIIDLTRAWRPWLTQRFLAATASGRKSCLHCL